MSIVSISYNQEEYIREALDGFAAQRTEFPVEVIIADDASTDATPRIIGEYAARYPQLFRPILRQTNIGVHANFKDVLSAARGEYLALCEGDDYWTDPLKLSKQVKYLDRHPETTVCFHPVRVIYEDGAKDSEFPPLSWRRDLSVDALLARNGRVPPSAELRRHPGQRHADRLVLACAACGGRRDRHVARDDGGLPSPRSRYLAFRVH